MELPSSHNFRPLCIFAIRVCGVTKSTVIGFKRANYCYDDDDVDDDGYDDGGDGGSDNDGNDDDVVRSSQGCFNNKPRFLRARVRARV